jgi:hypothetical protein
MVAARLNRGEMRIKCLKLVLFEVYHFHFGYFGLVDIIGSHRCKVINIALLSAPVNKPCWADFW